MKTSRDALNMANYSIDLLKDAFEKLVAVQVKMRSENLEHTTHSENLESIIGTLDLVLQDLHDERNAHSQNLKRFIQTF